MQYDVIINPFKFEDFSSLKKRDAQRYFEWFISEIPHRMCVLNKYIAKDSEMVLDYSIESLRSIWEWFENKIRVIELDDNDYQKKIDNYPDWIWEWISKKDFDSETLAIAVDVAIYYGEVLRRNNKMISWSFVTKPKSYISVNRPLLSGFKSDLHIEPVRAIQGMMYKSLEEKNSERLIDAYRFVMENMLRE